MRGHAIREYDDTGGDGHEWGTSGENARGDVEESKSKLPFALKGSSGIMAVRMTGETGRKAGNTLAE